MSKKHRPLTVNEMASLGGRARAKRLSPERRREIARKAWLASAEARNARKNHA